MVLVLWLFRTFGHNLPCRHALSSLTYPLPLEELSTKYSHLLQKHYVYFETRSTYLATTFVHMCSYDDGEAGVIDNRPICSDDI